MARIDFGAGLNTTTGDLFFPAIAKLGASLTALENNVVLPAAPTLNATSGDSQITLAWTDGPPGSSPITGHRLYAGPSSNNLALVGTIASASPYIDMGLTNGVARYYALSAVSSAGEGPRSAVASAIPAAVSAVLGEFGINIQGMDPYNRALVPVDLMRAGQLRLTDYNNVYDPSIDVVSPRVNASDVGMDAYGWPTTSPSGKQVMVAFDCANRGFSADQSGTYDVTFPPGLDWSLAGNCGMSRTTYNLAAGTATIVIVPDTAGVSPRFVFNSYNGVANTFPPYSPSRAFKAIKRGEDLDGFLTKASLDSIFGITSAAKPHTGFKGWVRIMTPNGINRQAQTNTTYNRTRTTPDVNRLGVATGSGQFLIEHQLQMAIKRGANLWVNLPDTNTVEANKRIAQYLYDNVPAGMRFVVEWSNEIYFNFFGPFAQTGDLFARSKITYPATNGNLQRQYGIEVRQYMVEPFEQVFNFGDPRYIPVVGVQSAQANYGFINQEFIDAGDLKSRIKGICTGPYIAGGIAGVNIGSYTEQSIFTKASRDKAGVDDAGFLTDMFAAQKVMSQKVYNENWKTFLTDMKRYAVDNGLPENRYLPMAYEFSWQHYNMNTNHKVNVTGAISGNVLTVSANSGPPLRPDDVLVKTDITTGTKVIRQIDGTPGGVGTYEVSVSQTSASGTITSSTNMYARAVGRLLAQGLRDPRAGAAQVEQMQWLRGTDGVFCLFDHAGSIGSLWDDNANAPVNSGSNWGMEDRIGNEAIDDPYKSVSAYLQANG